MKKIFIDTNVWLRFLLQDVKEQGEDCIRLMKLVEAGQFRPYTSAIVLLELQYVLTVVYKIARRAVIEDIGTILETRGLVLLEKTNLKKAFALYRQAKTKLADCLIATALPDKMILCSYDREFKNFKDLEVKTPGDLVQ